MTPKEMVSWLNSQDDEMLWDAAIIIERQTNELKTARNDALEEAALLADEEWFLVDPDDDYGHGVRDASENISNRIRALKGE